MVRDENFIVGLLKKSKNLFSFLSLSGVFFIVSYGPPDHRLPHLEKEDYGWQVVIG